MPQTQWQRDPLGLPFQTNLRWGHRFLQASLILPLYQQDGQSSSRTIPIRFELAPVIKKPGKKATPEQLQAYARQKKEHNLSTQFVALTQEIRQRLNQTGYPHQRLSRKNGRKDYRKPADRLTPDRTTPARVLLQAYCDRWGIEVNHRDEKNILGVGQAQVWNEHSVSKVPALLVAMYSWLL